LNMARELAAAGAVIIWGPHGRIAHIKKADTSSPPTDICQVERLAPFWPDH
jgi:hypothetical protein